MTENQWWATKIKPVWHNPQLNRVARKVQDMTNKGMPDVDLCFKGVTAKVELKYVSIEHKDLDHAYTFSTYAKKKTDPDYDGKTRATMLSREQVRNLEEWANAGGNAFVLVGIAKRWWLVRFSRVLNFGMTLHELEILSSARGDIKQISLAITYLEGLR